MSYSVVFSSKTGNTERIAKRIRKAMGEQDCAYFGNPQDAPADARFADVVFVGSWTDKGQASSEAASFLSKLDGRRVFLFGTCGFGASDEYFNQVLARFRGLMPASCELAGSFMCQGSMEPAVRERYETMLAAAAPGSPEAKRAQLLIDNFDAALSHPNNDDYRILEGDLREAGLI